jgi:periplasmic protein CpxP/Spy
MRRVTSAWAIAAAAILLALGPAPAGADEGYGHGKGKGYEGRHGGGHGMMGMMGGGHATTGHLLRGLIQSQKEMGLTEEQVAKLKALQLELDKTRIKSEADIMVAERELQALMEDDKTELPAIEEKLKQSEGMQTALRLAALKTRRDAMALLTPEQRQRVKAVHDAMIQKYKDGPKGAHGMMKGEGHKGDGKKGDAKP